MHPFEAKHWSWVQVVMWICIRHKDVVRWSAHEPGRTQLLDLSLGPDGLDAEPPDNLESWMLPESGDPPYFDSEEELFLEAYHKYGNVMSFDDARKTLIKAENHAPKLHAYVDSGHRFYDRDAVLDKWPEKSDAIEEPAAPAPVRKQVGRRPDFDPKLFEAETRSRLSASPPKGDVNLAQFVRSLQKWYESTSGGRPPSETWIKNVIRPLVRESENRQK